MGDVHMIDDQETSPAVLWTHKAISCTCLQHASDKIEVRLVVAQVVVQREFFADADSAGQFVVDRMRVCKAI